MKERLRAWLEGELPLDVPAEYRQFNWRHSLHTAFDGFEMPQPSRNTRRAVGRLAACALVLFLAALLLCAVWLLPGLGTADSPTNNEVARRYVEQGLAETGAVNLVTGVILDYRAFDTFGEICVLFLAAGCVTMLLQEKRPHVHFPDPVDRPVVLQTLVRFLTPCILLFGLYVIFDGHLSPGGGFSGGALWGAGLILYANAYGSTAAHRVFSFTIYRRLCAGSLLMYAAVKAYSFFMGANGLTDPMPKGAPGQLFSGGWILLLNLCVGLVVGGTVYAFFRLFRKGDL